MNTNIIAQGLAKVVGPEFKTSLRKTMIVLATAGALTGGLTADAFARGGFVGGGFGAGAHMGGGGGAGAHMSGLVGGGAHMSGLVGGSHEGRSAFDGRHFGRGRRFYGFYDACSYGYPYYNPNSCYLPAY